MDYTICKDGKAYSICFLKTLLLVLKLYNIFANLNHFNTIMAFNTSRRVLL